MTCELFDVAAALADHPKWAPELGMLLDERGELALVVEAHDGDIAVEFFNKRLPLQPGPYRFKWDGSRPPFKPVLEHRATGALLLRKVMEIGAADAMALDGGFSWSITTPLPKREHLSRTLGAAAAAALLDVLEAL